jgi:Protein of unknown function (DUF4012)
VLLGVGAFLVLFLAVVVDGYLQAVHYGKELRDLFPAMRAARGELLKSGDSKRFVEVERRAEGLAHDVAHARFTFGLTGLLPMLGRPVDAVRFGADAADHGARALELGRQVWVSVVGGPGGQALLRDGTVNLDLVKGFEPKAAAIVDELRVAERDLRAIPHVPFVGRIDAIRAEALAQTREALVSADRALAGVRVLPALLGADGPRTYYLALQNNADLRATGGAVLGFGIIRIADGRIHLIGGGGINDIDTHFHGIHPAAGGAGPGINQRIKWYLHATGRPALLNNGANYEPSFPIVATAWARQVEAVTHRHIDDVIALDPAGVQALLKGQGSFHIRGYHGKLSSRSIAQFTEHDQYGLPANVQKAVPRRLVEAAFASLSSPKDIKALVASASKAIAEKRIQLWSSDKAAQGLLTELGWDNAIHRGHGDYLFLTDNKRNSNKIDYFTHTSIDDTVTVDAQGNARVNALITLDDRIPRGENDIVAGKWAQYGLNVAMLSLYVPRQAYGVIATPAVGVGFKTRPQGFLEHVDGGRRVYTKIITAWKRHPGTLRLQYRIPGLIQETSGGKLYELMVQHQPLVHPARLTVRLVLPDGSTVTRAGAGWSVHGNQATYHDDLTRDLVTSVAYR